MRKTAEEKALGEYPDVTLNECHGDIKMMHYCNDGNSSLRDGYIKGYDQARSDIRSKVQKLIDSLRKNNPNPFGNESELMAASEIEAFNMVLDIIGEN